jgi:hypothetical protein
VNVHSVHRICKDLYRARPKVRRGGGKPRALADEQRAALRERLASGLTQRAIAAEFGVCQATILRERLKLGLELPKPYRKLSAEQVLDMRRRHNEGATYGQLARWNGVRKQAVHQAVQGITWKHLPTP